MRRSANMNLPQKMTAKCCHGLFQINKDGNGTPLGVFFEDEISGPTILTVITGMD